MALLLAMVVVVVAVSVVLQPAVRAAPADETLLSGGAGPESAFDGPLDLTHPLSARAQNWPGGRTFEFTKVVAEDFPSAGGFLSFNEFCMAEHLGTHLDAPYHFNKSNWKTSEIPVGRLIGPGVLLDATAEAAADRDLALGAGALARWEAAHGRVPAGAIVLVRFGWADKYGDRRAYFGVDSDDRNSSDTDHLSFPGLSAELARALARREVAGVGLDTPSVDPGKAGDHAPHAHRALCDANAFILENVNLRTTALPPKGFTVLALPAKIEGGTGAPVRIVALPGQHWF